MNEYPRTVHELKRLWQKHREAKVFDIDLPCDYADCPGNYKNFHHFLKALEFAVEFPVDEKTGEKSGKESVSWSSQLGYDADVALSVKRVDDVNYPDDLTPVAQYMAGIKTEDTLMRGTPTSDSKASDIAGDQRLVTVLNEYLSTLNASLNDISDRLSELQGDVDDLIDRFNNSKVNTTTTYNVVVKVSPGMSERDITKAVMKGVKAAGKNQRR